MTSISRAERGMEAHAIFCFESLRSEKEKSRHDFFVSDAPCRFPTWFVAHFLVEGRPSFLPTNQNKGGYNPWTKQRLEKKKMPI